jgi:hypothetical protein
MSKATSKVNFNTIVLTKNENYIVNNYDNFTGTQIAKKCKLKMKDYRGLTAKLSKLGLILTPNAKKKQALAQKEQEKNTFINVGGAMKQVARDVLIQSIQESCIVGKVLSLPFATCGFELQLLEDVSSEFRFIGVERVDETYYNMLQTVIDNQLNMSCVHGQFIDTVKTLRKNSLAHVNADFCGFFDDYHQDIQILLKSKAVVVGGTIGITFANRSFKTNSDIVNQMNELNPTALIHGNEVENAIRTFLIKESKNNYSLTKVLPYKDDERQAMILFVLKRIK